MPQKSDKTILVIDDDNGIRTAMEYMLKDAGYKVKTRADATDIHKINNQEVGLVLIDLLLSGNDGKNIVKKLKSKDTTKNIPIIMLSAHPSAKEQAKESGANAFLAKPFNVDDLLKVIEEYLL